MDKKDLAEEIREVEYKKKKKNKYKISSFSDEQVIINYITCSCCGKVSVNEEDMENIIKIAHNEEQFLVMSHFVESMRNEEYGIVDEDEDEDNYNEDEEYEDEEYEED